MPTLRGPGSRTASGVARQGERQHPARRPGAQAPRSTCRESPGTMPVAIDCGAGWMWMRTLSTTSPVSPSYPWASAILARGAPVTCHPAPNAPAPGMRDCGAQLPNIRCTLLIGSYAQAHYLSDDYNTLTERVRHWRELSPAVFVLPHPSPRNQLWLRRNPWFESETVPALQEAIRELL